MKRKRLIALLMAGTLSASLAAPVYASENVGSAAASTEIVQLRANYQVNPLGVASENLRFSWNMASNVIGKMQKSYRIVVTKGAADGETVWDTGVVENELSTGIQYESGELEYETRYYWNVTVIDNDGNEYKSEPAYFETGTSWDDVSWIVPSDDPAAGNTYAI